MTHRVEGGCNAGDTAIPEFAPPAPGGVMALLDDNWRALQRSPEARRGAMQGTGDQSFSAWGFSPIGFASSAMSEEMMKKISTQAGWGVLGEEVWPRLAAAFPRLPPQSQENHDE